MKSQNYQVRRSAKLRVVFVHLMIGLSLASLMFFFIGMTTRDSGKEQSDFQALKKYLELTKEYGDNIVRIHLLEKKKQEHPDSIYRYEMQVNTLKIRNSEINTALPDKSFSKINPDLLSLKEDLTTLASALETMRQSACDQAKYERLEVQLQLCRQNCGGSSRCSHAQSMQIAMLSLDQAQQELFRVKKFWENYGRNVKINVPPNRFRDDQTRKEFRDMMIMGISNTPVALGEIENRLHQTREAISK